MENAGRAVNALAVEKVIKEWLDGGSWTCS